VEDAGLVRGFEADSAGTGDWHVGEHAHPGTRQELEDEGIPYDGRARLMTRYDMDDFDYIVTLDESIYRTVMSYPSGKAKVVRLMDYAPSFGTTDVPDPYYTGSFSEVFKMIQEASSGLLEALRREHGL
jgi:protein-tyrosine phosphatase